MEKRYSWNIQISAWLLLSMAILLFLANLCVYLYLSPAAKAISGKAEEEKGFLNLQINPPVIPISPGGGAGAGGGGGGGISGVDLQKIGKPFTISPSSMSISLVEGEKVLRQLTIRNNLYKDISLSTSVVLLDSVLEVPMSVSLQAIEEKIIDIKAGPAEKGILTGKIIFSSGSYSQEVPIVIDVKSKNFLFDISSVIPSSKRRVVAGTEIPLEISMQQVASPAKVDVTVNYVVKDFMGVSYFQESETMSVENSKSYIKKIPTDNLPLGKYVAGIEVLYPGAFATSSAQFEIISPEEARISGISYYLSIIALCLVIVSVVLIVGILLRQNSMERKFIRKIAYQKERRIYG